VTKLVADLQHGRKNALDFEMVSRPMYGMVWYGMVWYGTVWYGTVWYGMAWVKYAVLTFCTHTLIRSLYASSHQDSWGHPIRFGRGGDWGQEAYSGQEYWNPVHNGLAPECEGDKKRLCADVKPGGGRTHQCILDKKEELSEGCRRAEFNAATKEMYGKNLTDLSMNAAAYTGTLGGDVNYNYDQTWDPALNGTVLILYCAHTLLHSYYTALIL
jgi:hypothetical protein